MPTLADLRRVLMSCVCLVLSLLTGLLVASGEAQCPPYDRLYDPAGYETITVTATPIGFTRSLVESLNATAAYITTSTDDIIYTFFGTPSATVGHLKPKGTEGAGWICGRTALLNFRAVQVTTSASLRVTYFIMR